MARMILLLIIVILFQGAIGELVCEELPVGMCSYSVASSGKRCTLESTFEFHDKTPEFQCKTSQIIATNVHEYVERDACVHACGVDRNSAGISSDALLETLFTTQLCSPECFHNCPNIVDLYYNLALAEVLPKNNLKYCLTMTTLSIGVLLDELCKLQEASLRRSAIQIQGSSAAAEAPTTFSLDCSPPPM